MIKNSLMNYLSKKYFIELEIETFHFSPFHLHSLLPTSMNHMPFINRKPLHNKEYNLIT